MAESSYRESPARCPACALDMEQVPVEGETIDACPACGGVWLDWYDGDVATLVAQVSAPAPPAPGDAPTGARTCPRCQIGMAVDDSHGAEARVWRCRMCAGTFVPRAAFDGVLDAPEPAPAGPRSFLGRLSGFVRGLINR